MPSPDDCAARVAQFNSTWFEIEKLPGTWRLELAFYIICMTTLLASVAVRLIAGFKSTSDWLKARSMGMMIMCHVGALIQFQTGGLSKIVSDQTECWFHVLGSLLIVPLGLIPVMVKLIWFKSSATFNTAVRLGVHHIVHLEESEGEESIKLKDHNEMGTPREESQLQKDEVMRNLRRWRFYSSRTGVCLVFIIILFPFFVVALSTFAITDSVYFTTCTGCVLNFTHSIFIIAFALISILLALFFSYQVRSEKDPFGHVREVKQAVLYGASIALVGFVLNTAVPAESWVDGWSWNIIVAIGLLIFSVIQGGYQVWVARSKHSMGHVEAVRPTPSRQSSIVDPSSNLNELLQLVFTKKAFRDAFEQYLCSEFAVESLSFLEAVNYFKQGYYDRGTLSSTALAKRIVKTFVKENSTLTINVSADQRHELLDRVECLKEGEAVPYDAFDECYLEVFKMVELGPLVRFTHTKEFADLHQAGIFEGAFLGASKMTSPFV